jgi:hypothetical protein
VDQATIDRIRTDFPAYANLLGIPEIADLLGRAAAEGWDITKLQANLYASTWWTGQSEAQRNSAILQRTDPGQWQSRFENLYWNINDEVKRLGQVWGHETLIWYATRALNEGWDATMTTRQILAEMRRQGGGEINPGVIAANHNSINFMARQYGVAIPEAMARQLAYDVAGNANTMEGVKQYFFNQALWNAASQGNEQLEAGLRNGYTVWDIMAPTLGLVAEELEIPVDTLDLTKGLGQQVYNYRDPETNKIRIMTQSEATQFARSQEQWRHTNRAEGIVAETTNAISRFMGVKS